MVFCAFWLTPSKRPQAMSQKSIFGLFPSRNSCFIAKIFPLQSCKLTYIFSTNSSFSKIAWFHVTTTRCAEYFSTRRNSWQRCKEQRNRFPRWTACCCIQKKHVVMIADVVNINNFHKEDFVLLISEGNIGTRNNIFHYFKTNWIAIRGERVWSNMCKTSFIFLG